MTEGRWRQFAGGWKRARRGSFLHRTTTSPPSRVRVARVFSKRFALLNTYGTYIRTCALVVLVSSFPSRDHYAGPHGVETDETGSQPLIIKNDPISQTVASLSLCFRNSNIWPKKLINLQSQKLDQKKKFHLMKNRLKNYHLEDASIILVNRQARKNDNYPCVENLMKLNQLFRLY